jgi:hypothetical protein
MYRGFQVMTRASRESGQVDLPEDGVGEDGRAADVDKSHHSASGAIRHDLEADGFPPEAPRPERLPRPCPTIRASGVSPAADGVAIPVIRGAEPHPGTRTIPLGTSAALQSFYAVTLRTG